MGIKEAEVEGENIEGLKAVSHLQEGFCPDCGQPVKTLYHNHNTGKPVQWTKPVDSTWLTIWGVEEIADSGYYRIPHREWQGGSLSPNELMRLEKMEHRARDNPTVRYVAVLARERLKKKRANEVWWDEIMSQLNMPSF